MISSTMGTPSEMATDTQRRLAFHLLEHEDHEEDDEEDGDGDEHEREVEVTTLALRIVQAVDDNTRDNDVYDQTDKHR